MDKTIIALGLMSGTSMDGIDASLIKSDGLSNIEIIGDLYLKYDSELKSSLHNFCNKINSIGDLKVNVSEYQNLERLITIKHSEIASKISKLSFTILIEFNHVFKFSFTEFEQR